LQDIRIPGSKLKIAISIKENGVVSKSIMHPLLPHPKEDQFSKKKKMHKSDPNCGSDLFPTKPTSCLSFSCQHSASLSKGWVITNNPAMAELLVPCFP